MEDPTTGINATVRIIVGNLIRETRSIPEGYKELAQLKVTDEDFYLQVKFTLGIDSATVNTDTVYIIDEFGEKIEVAYQFESNDEKLNIHTPSTNYQKGVYYYLIVNDGVTTKEGLPLVEPVITEFIWDDASGILELHRDRHLVRLCITLLNVDKMECV